MVKMRQNVRKFRPILGVVTLALLVVGIVALAAAPAFASPDGGDILFEQPPDTPASFGAAVSDAGWGSLCLDDFWDVTSDIGDIHWYGFSMDREEEDVPCNVTGMEFEIIFYQDSSGSPGAPVATFSHVTPAITVYDDYGFLSGSGYHFEVADLGAPVSLTKGWVSIQSTYSPNGCVFLWLTSPTGNNNGRQLPDGMEGENLAFALSAAPTPPPTPPSPPGVPTVNHWGIVAMITLFAGLLVWTVRRRRAAS
jgi:hypothetical protein